jgi:2-oxo-3-hexenedioate decarboxylase
MSGPPQPSSRALADILWRAARARTAIDPLTETRGPLDEPAAYAVQDELVALRTAAGERVVGAKLGFTSAAMREQMGVDSPNWGWLTDAMVLTGEDLPLDAYIHPRVEPEICFVLGAALRGPAVTAAQVLEASAAIAPALEIVDSRYRDYRFTACDNIADNSSAAGVRVGPGVEPGALRLDEVAVVLERDGEVVDRATGAAALGHPAEAVAWLANRLADAARALQPGDLVLSGGLTAATPVRRGERLVARFDGLGSVAVRGAGGG